MADSKEDLYLNAIHTAHELLHKGNVDQAHEVMHMALLGESKSIKAIDKNEVAFDLAFRDISVQFGIEAAYVRFVPMGKVAEGHQVSIRTGGHVRQNTILEKMLATADKKIG